MTLPTLKEVLKSRLLLPAIVFFAVNSTHSYMFYQVNSFKIFMVFVGVTIIALIGDLITPQKYDKSIPWKWVLFAALPLLATIPGLIWYQAEYNYNFPYELSTSLVLLVWIIYLLRGTQQEKDLHPFLFLLGLTVIYAGAWAILERFGMDPFNFGGQQVMRVKSTFGNINYFAGFLVVMTPVMLTLAIPSRGIDTSSGKGILKSIPSVNWYFIIVFIFALVSLILTRSRAGMSATIISTACLIGFYLIAFAPQKYRKRILMGFLALILLAITALILAILFQEHLPTSRYTRLLTLRGWTPRLGSWTAAVESILSSPIIGYGLGSSYNLYFQFADPNARLYWHEHSYNHAHSEPLEYLQESGLVGLVVFVLFWGFLALSLIRLFSHNERSLFSKKLAIGVLCAFIGYHLQSFFSVAPRMMVTKLPLYTMIAVAIFLIGKYKTVESDDTSNRLFLDRIKGLAPSLLILVITAYLYIPWIIGQYKFVKIQRQRPSLRKAEQLEAMVKEYPDAYALDFLSHIQVQYRRVDQLQETLNTIDEVLPYYRELGHTKAVLAVLQRDLEKAKKAALTYQSEQDRYFHPTILLLMGLSLDTNDYPVFKTQLELLTRKLIFDKRLYTSFDADDVQIEFKPLDQAFFVEQGPDSFQFHWNEKYVDNFFKIGRSNRSQRSFTQNQRNSFVKTLAFHFQRNPYFRIQLKEAYKDESMKDVNNKIKQYYILSQAMTRERNKILKQQKRELGRTARSEWPSLKKKQVAEVKQQMKPYQDQLDSVRVYLKERTNWPQFQKRQDFVRAFIQEFTKVIYPGRAKAD